MGQRLNALTIAALEQPVAWATGLDLLDAEARIVVVRAVAAYRDRWSITSTSSLVPIPADDSQRIDCERTRDALTRLQQELASNATRSRNGRPGERSKP